MTLDLVIPAYNEQDVIGRNIDALCAFLARHGMADGVAVVIAENGSTDRTFAAAQEAASRNRNVRCLRMPSAGRGAALRAAWLGSSADLVGYMDADLATDLSVLPAVFAAFAGGGDLVVGSRLRRGAKVRRGLKREIISRTYNLLVRALLRPDLSDTQCGCKFLRRDVAAAMLPSVANDNWFFDTELVVRAAEAGYRVVELPVSWEEKRERRSTVRIIPTIAEEFGGILRLRKSLKR